MRRKNTSQQPNRDLDVLMDSRLKCDEFLKAVKEIAVRNENFEKENH